MGSSVTTRCPSAAPGVGEVTAAGARQGRGSAGSQLDPLQTHRAALGLWADIPMAATMARPHTL